MADSLKLRIRKITSTGIVSTVSEFGTANFANSAGTSAQSNSPRILAVDLNGDIYEAEGATSASKEIERGPP